MLSKFVGILKLLLFCLDQILVTQNLVILFANGIVETESHDSKKMGPNVNYIRFEDFSLVELFLVLHEVCSNRM